MATVAEILVALAPEFAAVDEDRVELIIELAEARVSATYAAAVRSNRVALEAARMLALGNQSASGAVASESVGPLSISYATGGTAGSTRFDADIAAMDAAYVFAAMTRTMG